LVVISKKPQADRERTLDALARLNIRSDRAKRPLQSGKKAPRRILDCHPSKGVCGFGEIRPVHLIKLLVLTFDDRTRSVERLMPSRRSESACGPRLQALDGWLPDMDSNHE
jgi:hypothetical protein